MKKTKKTTNKKPVVEVVRPTVPAVEPKHYSVVLAEDELAAMVQLFSFSKDLFAQMASNMGQEPEGAKAQEIYTARSQLSHILYNKFLALAAIGEPTSRDLH